jgi:hypothetical protein
MRQAYEAAEPWPVGGDRPTHSAPTAHPQRTHSALTAPGWRPAHVVAYREPLQRRAQGRGVAFGGEPHLASAIHTRGAHTGCTHGGLSSSTALCCGKVRCSNGGGQALLWQGPGVCVRMMGWAHAAKGDGGLGGARLLHQRRERKLERTPTSPGCGREQRLVCCGLRIDLALPRAVAPRHVSVKRE